jgi:hypothetical protein
MSWYNKITKTAAAKNKIQKYKVDDPSLKLFIHKYENSIPWDQISSAEDIQNYISAKKLPELKSKIDINSEDNNYLKDIDLESEYRNHPDDPQVQQALAIYQQDPERAKGIILNQINEEKEKVFNNWWNYLTEEDVFANNPALIYSIAKPIIDSSPKTKKVAPPPLNQEALGLVLDEITTQGSTQINVLKRYNKISSKIDKASSEVVQTDLGNEWMKIPGKPTDPSNYSNNLEKLMRISQGTNWCVAGNTMAERYLSQGDFWLYIENGVTSAAIRLIGNKKVAEIRGRGNGQDPKPYWEPIVKFLSNTDFDYKNNSHYKPLEEMMLMNADLKSNPQNYDMVLNKIKDDYKNYKLLSDQNKADFPEFTKIAAKGYETRLHNLLDNVENLPPEGKQYQSRFGIFQKEYSSVPQEIKPFLSDAIEGRILSVHKNAFYKNPLELEDFPPEIQASISDQDKIEAWSNYVEGDPYRYNNPKIPLGIKEKIPVSTIINPWLDLININIKHLDNMPSEIIQLLPPNFIQNKVISDFQSHPFARTKFRKYEKLERVKKMNLMSDEEIINTYINAVAKRPDLAKFTPDQYKQVVMNSMQSQGTDQLTETAKNDIIINPLSFITLNENIQKSLINKYPLVVGQSFAKLRSRYQGNLDGFWRSLPTLARPCIPPALREEVVMYYKQYVDRNPAFLIKVPPDLQPDVLSKMAKLTNWYVKIS